MLLLLPNSSIFVKPQYFVVSYLPAKHMQPHPYANYFLVSLSETLHRALPPAAGPNADSDPACPKKFTARQPSGCGGCMAS